MSVSNSCSFTGFRVPGSSEQGPGPVKGNWGLSQLSKEVGSSPEPSLPLTGPRLRAVGWRHGAL